MNANNPNAIRDELEDLEAVRARLAGGATDWHRTVIQNVDLRPLDAALGRLDLAGCQFYGCVLGPEAESAVARSQHHADPCRHCLVFPRMPWLPFNPYRHRLYHPEELLGVFPANGDPDAARAAYARSVDWSCYLSFADPADHRPYTNDSADTLLARRLHDTFISDALEDLLAPVRHRAPGAPRGVVGIMGGHDMERRETAADAPGGSLRGTPAGDSPYARTAFLAWELARRGYLLVSGGGPGAMEATNLGAYFSTRGGEDLRAAIRMLEAFPKFMPGRSADWLAPAMAVRRRFPPAPDPAGRSLGIPTWAYGHEPPNPFASHIAKYFENSVREEGLLAIATAGVIFVPGNAGTVQEIFQDACQNYYGTHGPAVPMILFGREYWDPTGERADRSKPVAALLRKLLGEKKVQDRVLVTDCPAEAVRKIEGFCP